MANSVLSKLVGTDNETKKALSSIQATVDKIAGTQESMLAMQEKLAKRAAQDKKRDSGDKGIMGLFKKQEEDKKKKDSWWKKLLKILGPLAGLLGGLGRGLGSVLNNVIGKPLGIIFRETMAAAARTLFGKDGVISKVWNGAFGQKGWARKAWTKAFGPKGWAAQGWTKAFGKGGWASKAMTAVGNTGIGKGLQKFLAPITAFFTGKGAKNLLGNVIGKTGLGKMVRGAGLGAVIEGITTYQETGDIGQAGAAGGGAFAGGLGGAKLGAVIGSFIAPGIGTAIGGFLGGVGGTIIGSELGQTVYKAITENPAFIAISDWYKGYLEGLFGSFMETWNAFTEMVDVLGKALQKFYGDVIEPFFASIGQFFQKTWNAVVEGVQKFFETVQSLTNAITDFIGGVWDNFIGNVEAVADFFGLDLTPVMEAFKAAVDAVIQPFEWLKEKAIDPLIEAVQNLLGIFGNFPSGEEVGKAVGDVVFGGPRKFFEWMTGGLSNYVDGNQEGGIIGRQSGGIIPTMLEPGEAVFGPGQWSPGIAAMNSQFPRFQTGGIVPGTGTGDIYGPVGLPTGSFVLNRNATSMLGLQTGGEVPQSQASGARSKPTQITPDQETEKKEAEAAVAMTEANTAGADAIIAAAEQSVGIYKGVSVMCARSTRDVLRLAGHPAADKSTQSGDLDVPVGYAVNGMDLAGSFAGSDMGTPYNDPRQAPPGSILLWRGTYDVAKYGPDAITHVGLKGKGSDMYHHGKTPGWRKDSLSRYMPDLAVDLNGEATGDPSSINRTGGGANTVNMGTNLLGQLSGLGAAGEAMAGVFEIFNEVMGEDAAALQQALGLTQAVAEQVVADDKLQTNLTTTASSPGGNFGESSLVKALNDAGITNKNERAMFLSQMAHESGNFQYDEEIHDGSNYEGRSDLGNTQAGDGKRYKGRGYIQITGRANYRKYGKIVGQDLEGNPELAKDPNIAAAVALAYWNDRVDRKAAQKGDIRTVTYNINGGYNGLQDRITKFDQYKAKGLQTGGVVNMKPLNNNKFLEANDRFAEKMAKGQQPVVIPVPMGGGGGQQQQVVKNPGTQTAPPTLPDGPSSIQSAEYFYRLNMGSVF